MGWGCPGTPHIGDRVCREKSFRFFKLKMQGFMHFLLRKTTSGEKPGPGGLTDPQVAEDVKRGLKI